MSILSTFKPSARDFVLILNEEGGWSFNRILRVSRDGSYTTRQLLFGNSLEVLRHTMNHVEGGIARHLPFLANQMDLKGLDNCIYIRREAGDIQGLELVRAGMDLGNGLRA